MSNGRDDESQSIPVKNNDLATVAAFNSTEVQGITVLTQKALSRFGHCNPAAAGAADGCTTPPANRRGRRMCPEARRSTHRIEKKEKKQPGAGSGSEKNGFASKGFLIRTFDRREPPGSSLSHI